MKSETVATLKRYATRLLSGSWELGVHLLIAAHDKPAACIEDIDSYELMKQRLSILEGIVRGERAALENRACSQAEARNKLEKWLD